MFIYYSTHCNKSSGQDPKWPSQICVAWVVYSASNTLRVVIYLNEQTNEGRVERSFLYYFANVHNNNKKKTCLHRVEDDLGMARI